jgi:hypothetical protein
VAVNRSEPAVAISGKRCAGRRQAVGLGGPTARSDDEKPEQRFSGGRSRFAAASRRSPLADS